MKIFSKIFCGSLLGICSIFANAQSTQSGLFAAGHSPGFGGVPIRYVGWDGSSAANAIPLSIEHRGTNDINFLTGGTQRMTILGTASANPGFVGIGLSTPAYPLDVQDRINITNNNALGFGYFINGFDVLQIPGVENTFVGRGTGANNLSIQNTFVGFQAGGSNTTGDRNTFVGRGAGFADTNGRFNTYIGADAGLNIGTGDANTFLGEHCGFQLVSGDNNTFIGSHCGQGSATSTSTDNTFIGMRCGWQINGGSENTFAGVRAGNGCLNGNRNSFYGFWAGLQTNSGTGNVAMGYRSDRFNHGGNNNTFIGTDAGVPGMSAFWGLNNASGIGFHAIARADSTMILGSNGVNVGIGLSNDAVANGPQNKLEIDAGLNGTAPSSLATTGASGLTFRDLHAGNTPSPANGLALSVTTSGEVILVPAAGGFPFGGACGNTNAMASNFEIPMGTSNFVFSGQGTSGTNVGIGMPSSGCSPTAKLEVHQNSTSSSSVAIGIDNVDPSGQGITLRINGGGASHTGISSAVQGASGQNNGFITNAFGGTQANGGIFKAQAGSSKNIGIEAEGSGGIQNFGFYTDITSSGAPFIAGVASRVAGGATNYGGRFIAPGPAGTNYGIFASAPIAPGNFAGYFDGDVVRTGTDNFTSDRNLKQNIDSISNALGIINLLLPKTFYFDTAAHQNIALSSKKQWGLIAQDVEPILPELVGNAIQPAELDSLGNIITPSLTYKTLNYNAFIAILIKGMQEQNAKIDSLQNQINSCCSSNTRTQNPQLNQTDVHLSDIESIVLDQNVPNPFAEQTTITYNLPETVQKAQLLFYDSQGKLIKAVDLTSRGKGQVNVFADDLTSGIYSYALVADGQIADTKRMVKMK
jgi:hypothetical protein